MTNRPPGVSSSAARPMRSSGRSSPSSPENKARSGSCSVTSPGIDEASLRRKYGGFVTTMSNRRPSSGTRKASPVRTSTPESPRLRRVHIRAASSTSTALTREPGTSLATARAIAPVPVHKSITLGQAPDITNRRASWMDCSATNSVSKRGINTPGPTSSRRPRNQA